MFAPQHNTDMANLHDNLKTNMAAIVNKGYYITARAAILSSTFHFPF